MAPPVSFDGSPTGAKSTQDFGVQMALLSAAFLAQNDRIDTTAPDFMGGVQLEPAPLFSPITSSSPVTLVAPAQIVVLLAYVRGRGQTIQG